MQPDASSAIEILSSISVVPLSREHRRYFYVNDHTSTSQWDFPNKETEEEEDQKGSQTPQPRATSDGEPAPPAVAPSGGIEGQSSALSTAPNDPEPFLHGS